MANKTALLIIGLVAVALGAVVGWVKFFEARDAGSKGAEELQSRSAELAATRDELDRARSDGLALMKDLERARDAMQGAGDQALETLREERDRVARAQQSVTILREQLAEQERAALAGAQALTGELERARAESQALAAELQAERAAAEVAASELRAQLEAQQSAARVAQEEWRAQLDALREAGERARRESAARLESERAMAAQAAQELNDRLLAERAQAEAAASELSTQLEAQRASAESIATELRQRLAFAEARSAELGERLDAQKRQADAERTELEARMEEQQREALAALEALRAAHQAQSAEAEAALSLAEARNKQLTRELAAARGAEQAARDEMARLRQAIARLAQNETLVSELNARLREADAGASSLEAALERARRETEMERRRFARLQSQLENELNDRSVRVQQLESRLTVIQVGTDILFRSGAADLSPAGKQALGLIASALNEYPDRAINVEGHTDDVPIGPSLRERYPTNWELSAARAASAARELQAMGVNPARLRVVGYGEHHPVAGNENEASRKRNRRIEIALLPRTERVEVIP